MKKITFFVALFFFSTTFVNAQLNLSFNAGANHHETTIGYKVGTLVPYVGFEFMRGGVKLKSEGDLLVDYSASVIMPNIGLKAFLISKESIKGGLNVGLFKPFISAKFEEEDYEYEDIDEFLDNFTSFGGNLSFFSEYFFSDQFSVGGEFGYRFANFKITNPDDSNDNLKVNLGGTFTSFNVNFYF